MSGVPWVASAALRIGIRGRGHLWAYLRKLRTPTSIAPPRAGTSAPPHPHTFTPKQQATNSQQQHALMDKTTPVPRIARMLYNGSARMMMTHTSGLVNAPLGRVAMGIHTRAFRAQNPMMAAAARMMNARGRVMQMRSTGTACGLALACAHFAFRSSSNAAYADTGLSVTSDMDPTHYHSMEHTHHRDHHECCSSSSGNSNSLYDEAHGSNSNALIAAYNPGLLLHALPLLESLQTTCMTKPVSPKHKSKSTLIASLCQNCTNVDDLHTMDRNYGKEQVVGDTDSSSSNVLGQLQHKLNLAIARAESADKRARAFEMQLEKQQQERLEYELHMASQEHNIHRDQRDKIRASRCDTCHSLSTTTIRQTAPINTFDAKEIVVGSLLGKGSFGSVHRAIFLHTPCAVKIIKNYDDAEKECLLLNTLSHPNVVCAMGVSHADGCSMVLMEACDESLHHAIFLRDAPYMYLEDCMYDVACGMAFLHRCSILHLDLKPANVLLKNHRAKICDVGASVRIDDNESDLHTTNYDDGMTCSTMSGRITTTTQGGSIMYSAPEVLSHNLISRKCDVYSFGIMLWSIMTRREAYAEMNVVMVCWNVVCGSLRPDVTLLKDADSSRVNLMEECWSQDPEARPSFIHIAAIMGDHQPVLIG